MKSLTPTKIVLILLPVAGSLWFLAGQEAEKQRLVKVADNKADAQKCIELNAEALPLVTSSCNRVDSSLLPEDLQEPFAKARAENKAREERSNKKAAQEAAAVQAKREEERLARGEWTYSTYTDEATGKKAKRAYLTSKNSMNFGFPYSGTQYGQFTVRNHPRFGVEAFLQIDKGQLLCNSFSNTTVLVRFDNGPATRYGCNGAADHSSEIVFIENVAGLEARMKTAKKMFITVSVYQEGSRTWEFNVRGYDRSRI